MKYPTALLRLMRAARLALLASLLAPLLGIAQTGAGTLDASRRPGNERWIGREVTLTDLGFTGPLVLGAPDNRRELYLPVPANVPLANAEIRLNASFMRADGGRTSLVISVDGTPASSRAFPLDKGDASITIPVDGAPRASGFVRLDLNWTTALGADWLCADARTPGNVLRIEPDSRFTFRYDAGSIRDLTTAWGALPPAPTILLSSSKLDSAAYDSAWRLGLALERAGKRPRYRTPSAGGERPGPFGDDMVILIADKALPADATGKAPASKEIVLGTAFGRPAIVVAADAGDKAAGLFGNYWNKVAVSPTVVVDAAGEPTYDSSAVSLKYLGGKPGSFEVLAHADWNATFDIGTVAADGRVPGTLVLDVAASPSAARTPPVVTVFMNDILLGAKQMEANGKRERLSVPVPRYTLAARNILRVSFTRQLASDRCRETPEPYPVSVLPSSHMLLEKADPSDDFNGMVARYARGAHVMVPTAYLNDALGTLPRVVRIAATAGVSPVTARFSAASPDAPPATEGSFLAIEVPPKDAKSKVKVESGRVVMTAGSEKPILDVAGLNNVGIVEVVKSGGDTGVLYRTVGTEPPGVDKPVLLAQGDVAILGPNGLVNEINTTDPSGRAVVGGARSGTPWLARQSYWWLVPVFLVVAMLALLVFASRRRRRAAELKG